MGLEEIICNRCGFGSDELEEGAVPANEFAQMGYEMYCNECVTEWKDGVWDLNDKPDKDSPTLENKGIVFSEMTSTDSANKYLYTYGPLYFEQKRKRSLQILDEVTKVFNSGGVV